MSKHLDPIVLDFFIHHPASRKDPRLYNLAKYFRETGIKKGSELGASDISKIYEFGNKIIMLSISDNIFRDFDKIAMVEAQSEFVLDVLQNDIIRRLLEVHRVLYGSMLRMRIGGRLIANSVMGRDFDTEVHGDMYIRILYKGYKHTRLVFALNPCDKRKALLLYQDGIALYRNQITIMNNMDVEKTESGVYISGLTGGPYTVESRVIEDGSVQIYIRKSQK